MFGLHPGRHKLAGRIAITLTGGPYRAELSLSRRFSSMLVSLDQFALAAGGQ